MKTKITELDVDFIGSQPSELTKEEEKAISNYIKAEKEKRKHRKTPKKTHTPTQLSRLPRS